MYVLYIYIYTQMYIYIYMYRERDVCIYIYIYIHTYVCITKIGTDPKRYSALRIHGTRQKDLCFVGSCAMCF